MKTSILFNLDFANNFILFFFSYILTYFLIPKAMAQTFDPIAELLICIGVPSKEAKINFTAETEIHPVIVEAIIGKFLV